MLSQEEISSLLIELENEDQLHFDKKETLLPATLKAYVLLRQAAWYWAVIALAVATTTTVLTIPNDVYLTVYIRSALGIVFTLFLPGFTLTKVLFPSRVPIKTDSKNLDDVERFALSLGMSLVLVIIVGLALNYTPWGIGLIPIVLSLLALTTIFATAAVFREYKKTNTDSA